jgi:hypothetical protein
MRTNRCSNFEIGTEQRIDTAAAPLRLLLACPCAPLMAAPKLMLDAQCHDADYHCVFIDSLNQGLRLLAHSCVDDAQRRGGQQRRKGGGGGSGGSSSYTNKRPSSTL